MKMKTRAYVISIFSVLLISLNVFSGCFFMLPISKKKRAEIYSYYSNDDNYVEVCGKLTDIFYSQTYGSGWLVISFDEEFISENQELFNNLFFQYYKKGVSCNITNKTYEILLENGFYDLLLDESEIDETAEKSPLIEEDIYIVTSYKLWVGEGVERPAVSVRVGDTVYLDYETGKANYLDWIQNDLW